MHIDTRSVTLSVHFPKYCEVKPRTRSFCGSHKSFRIIFCRNGLKILNTFIKKRATFGTDLCCSQHNIYAVLFTKHNLMQNFKDQVFI